jgi:hypothetical protein
VGGRISVGASFRGRNLLVWPSSGFGKFGEFGKLGMKGSVAAVALVWARYMSRTVATSCMLCGLSSARFASIRLMSWSNSGGSEGWIFDAGGGISEA